MTSCECRINIGEQRRNIDIELPGNIFSSGRNITERSIVLVEEFVVETLTDKFAGTLLDFADIDQYSVAWINGPGKNKIRNVIATRAVTSIGSRTENRQIFGVAPTFNVQTPRCRELQALTDGEEHLANNCRPSLRDGT